MANLKGLITDRQYYAEFEGRITMYLNTQEYFIGDIVRNENVTYELTVTGPITGETPGTGSSWTSFEEQSLGYKQFINLEEIVNNYMVLYSDEANHGGVAKRMKVEAFAQRAVQEFSYDTFKVKSFEYRVNDSYIMALPQDFVDLVHIVYINSNGEEQWMVPRLDGGAPRSAQQDDDNTFLFGDDGEIDYRERGSASQDAFDSTSIAQSRDIGSGNYVGYGGFYNYGRRYYLDTQKANKNFTYIFKPDDGVIYLEPNMAGETVTLRYVSDGLSSDLSEVRVHKFAEQAIYESIYYEMIAHSSTVPANEKDRAKRRMVGKKRETKLRLSPIGHREMLQILRGQSQWIKT